MFLKRPDTIPLDFGTLCAIAGSGLAGWKAVLDQDWKFGVAGAALGLAPAVYSAFKGSDIASSDQPLAYAALAKNRLFSQFINLF